MTEYDSLRGWDVAATVKLALYYSDQDVYKRQEQSLRVEDD